MDDRKRIAAIIRDYIARERMSREQFAFKTKLGKSTVDKLLIGIFSDRTLSIVESQTGLQLRGRSRLSRRPPPLPRLRSVAPKVLPSRFSHSQTWEPIQIRNISLTGSRRISLQHFPACGGSSLSHETRPLPIRAEPSMFEMWLESSGVRYVLEGSVRASGERIRVTGQLIDAATGKHIWAERYDRELRDIFDLQDEITGNVVASIEPHLYVAEGVRASTRAPDSIDAWGLVVRAIGLINRIGRRQNEEAQALLLRAIEIEPTYAKAHAVLGWAVWWAALCYWLPTREGYRQAELHAKNALSFDTAEPWSRMMLGLCLSTASYHQQALGELQAALELNPNFALGRTLLGWALLRAGSYDAAIAETGKPLRMSPMDSFAGIYTSIHGLALLGAGRFSDALPYLRSSVAAFSEYSGHYNTLISCCGHLGLVDEAKRCIEARNQIGPPIRVSVLRQNLGGFAHCEVFVQGLVKAGVPE